MVSGLIVILVLTKRLQSLSIMNAPRRIQSALISVFHKEGLEPIVAELKRLGVTIYSTGGTQVAL